MSFSNERILVLKARLHELASVFLEIYRGFLRRDKNLYRAVLVSVALGFLITLRWDLYLFRRFNLLTLYPDDGLFYRIYVPVVAWSPILLFGVMVRARKRKFAGELREIFDLIGLKNAIGAYPRFLSLEPLTGGTMKLRLTNGGFPLPDWQKRKERLEANMQVFIDEIRSNQEKGVVEITFSYDPMPTRVAIENISNYRDYKFLLGRGRGKDHIADFSQNPHFLVGGETGGGKSVFLRQLITTIKLNQPEAEFHLVDLKGGVEFGYLDKYPGMKVIPEVESAAAALKTIAAKLKERSQALKKRKLTKIEEFFASDEFRRMDTNARSSHVLGRRVFLVIDECAEVFLFGLGHAPAHTREIRAAMSQITRLGRFVGIHAVLGTQRPDKHAVDPQVKSNLTTTVCYRIHDHGGSLAVLGTGRAADLPRIPGRAILAAGAEEVEIQTPFLDLRESIQLLDQKFQTSPETEMDKGGGANDSEEGRKSKGSPEPDSIR